jgi:RNA polymerase sigma-70 factor, ECF subfamily
MNAAAAIRADEEPESMSAIDFEPWMAREQRRIYLLCLRLLRNSDEADSATQDIFLKAHRMLQNPKGREIESPEKWLTTVAVHTCLDRLRSKRWIFWRRTSGQNADALLRVSPASGVDQHHAMLGGEIRRRLDHALEKLAPRQRTVFVLRHDEDRSLEEIAGILGLDVGTVKAHLARAIRKLRDELRDLYVR